METIENSKSAHLGMEYNSLREKLIMPEYGRHVQKMLEYARKVENKEERQIFVELIVQLMEQVQSAKPSKELTDKLWNHVFMICEYDIDVEPPADVEIVKHTPDDRPDPLSYPEHTTKYRHYGGNVQKLIDKACKEEDEAKRTMFAEAIGSYMKLAYKTWNSSHYVSDEVIKGDLKSMSDGVLVLDEDSRLDYLKGASGPPSTARSQRGRKKGSSGGRGKGRSRSGKSRRRR